MSRNARDRTGVLLLHGFTAGLATVDRLVPHLEAARIPWRMPLLRGHGTRPEDLAGVTAAGWLEDAERALRDLFSEVPRAVVVGHSMGGLLALRLTMERPEIVGMVGLATALEFCHPLMPLSGLIARIHPYHGTEADARVPGNYGRYPLATAFELYRLARAMARRMQEIRRPLLLVHGQRDETVPPQASWRILEAARSERKALHLLPDADHQLLYGPRGEEVCALVMGFLTSQVMSQLAR